MVGRRTLSSYLDALEEYPVFLAHNANVDAMASVDALSETLQSPDDIATVEAQESSEDSGTVEILESLDDLASGVAGAMDRGDGDLVGMTDEFAKWLETRLEPEETKLGGQAAIMTELLSLLGASPVFYTYLLTPIQRSMFTDPAGVEFPVVRDGDLSTVPMSEVVNADQTKINWIFEFEEGDRFLDVTAGTDSRFIAASRPERIDLDTGLELGASDLGSRVECALLSGYHSLKEEYADGTTYEDAIERGRRLIRRLKRESGVPVQIEYGVTHNEGLRRAIAERIVPEVDAIGMDSRELDLLAADLGLADDGGVDGDAVQTYEKLERVRETLGIDCVKLHRTHYFVAATSEDYVAPDVIRRGWDFAAIVAAAKATTGTIRTASDLRVGLDVDFSSEGREAVRALADHLAVSVEEEAVTTDRVVAHPNRVVADPNGTVGIGDSVAVANFSLEQALAKRSEQSLVP